MRNVSGINRTNRPFFFNGTDGKRVEFPAFAAGSGTLDGRDLALFDAAVTAKQIEETPTTAKAKRPAAKATRAKAAD